MGREVMNPYDEVESRKGDSIEGKVLTSEGVSYIVAYVVADWSES